MIDGHRTDQHAVGFRCGARGNFLREAESNERRRPIVSDDERTPDRLPKFTEGSNGHKVEKVEHVLHDFFLVVDLLHCSTLGEVIIPEVPFVHNSLADLFDVTVRYVDGTFPCGQLNIVGVRSRGRRSWLVHGYVHAVETRLNVFKFRR